MRISITGARGRLTDLVKRAEAGEDIILTRRGRTTVRLVPVKSIPESKHRRSLLEAIRNSGASRATPGPAAARSQDFLYGERDPAE